LVDGGQHFHCPLAEELKLLLLNVLDQFALVELVEHLQGLLLGGRPEVSLQRDVL